MILRYAEYASAMSVSVRDAVAAEIRAEMARQQLSQQDLGDRLGRRQWWVSRRLTGHVAITADDLVAIARALGVPVGQFMTERQGAA